MLSQSDPRVGVSVNLPTWVGSLQTSCSGDLNPIQSLAPPFTSFFTFRFVSQSIPRLGFSTRSGCCGSCRRQHSSKPARLTHATVCDRMRRSFYIQKYFKFVYIPLKVILICVSLYQVCTRNLFLSIFAAELLLGNTRSTSTPEFPVLKVV